MLREACLPGNPMCISPFITCGSAWGEGLIGRCLDSGCKQQVQNSYTRGWKASRQMGILIRLKWGESCPSNRLPHLYNNRPAGNGIWLPCAVPPLARRPLGMGVAQLQEALMPSQAWAVRALQVTHSSLTKLDPATCVKQHFCHQHHWAG